jgi:hypothetical protein
MKKSLIGILMLIILGNVTTTYGDLIPIKATITADNHYALYYGDKNGSFVTLIGRNEFGTTGSPGQYNWSDAETFNFDMPAGAYLYIAAWSDKSTAQGLLGQFVLSNTTLLTNTSDWTVFSTGVDKGDGSAAPTIGELGSQISIANSTGWSTVTNHLVNGSSPWGLVSGIDKQADWIWGGALIGGANYGEYEIFRTQIAPVPVPGAMLLGSMGISFAGWLLRRRTA